MDRRLIAANWKMNGSESMARELIAALRESLSGDDLDKHTEVVIMPPAILVPVVRQALAGQSRIRLGVQNIAQWRDGAYTGEVSATMVADQGGDFAIIGHSERRELFGESDETVATKVRQALDADVTPIICVGETLSEREAGNAKAVVERQLRAAVEPVSDSEAEQVVIAYEPVWAIGTGVSASAEDAQAVHGHIRETLRALSMPADRIPLIYGGSVKPETAQQLFAQPDIDGGLIGGASLDADAFAAICRAG